MMDFELKLEKPKRRGAWIEGLVMGVTYFIGRHLRLSTYKGTMLMMIRRPVTHDPILRHA